MNPKSEEEIESLLIREFERRCQANPRYSLRAFAVSLSMDCSYLSKILRGKRKLSGLAKARLAQKMGQPVLPSARILNFSQRNEQRNEFVSLEEDLFVVIADWYHYAILEMTKLEFFRPDPKWIADYLGIGLAQVMAAVERLRACGLLDISPEGQWKVLNHTTTTHPFSNQAFRQLQKQILQQSASALENVPIELRDHSSITMCIDSRRLKVAKRMLKRFRRQLMNYLERGSRKDAVYQLSLSLFPGYPMERKENLA
jgi:hypothetical protein